MRGYTLKGENLFVNRETQFFKAASFSVSKSLKEEATNVLLPKSTETEVSLVRGCQGFLTVTGKLTEISIIKRVIVNQQPVPLKVVTLEHNSAHVTVNLWRDAALCEVMVGAEVYLTHLKGSDSAFGYQLQSSLYTTVKETSNQKIVEVLGAYEDSARPMTYVLLIMGGDTFSIPAQLWIPLEPRVEEPPFWLKIHYTGGKITEVEEVKEREKEAMGEE
ncbi:uncharacterized protein LOC117814172 [Notolabrus celidotus]|uniref:uncharacterized protein LOC117814172 n=1 Tax=Notolabrus celidotus TaxID=1203425 RepID=UPI00148FD798|nr:uncharacterized protein LOC117814172 [Notolabrus celidotus]